MLAEDLFDLLGTEEAVPTMACPRAIPSLAVVTTQEQELLPAAVEQMDPDGVASEARVSSLLITSLLCQLWQLAGGRHISREALRLWRHFCVSPCFEGITMDLHSEQAASSFNP